MNTNKTRIQAIISNSGRMLCIKLEKLLLKLNPSPYSKIKKGIPIIKIAIIYGIKKEPPPLEYSTYLNRQIFPIPIVRPIMAIMNVNTEFHWEFLFIIILVNVSCY